MELCGRESEQVRQEFQSGQTAAPILYRLPNNSGDGRPSRVWALSRALITYVFPPGSYSLPFAIKSCSVMGYEDLNVVDPTSGEAKAAETDMSDVSAFKTMHHDQ